MGHWGLACDRLPHQANSLFVLPAQMQHESQEIEGILVARVLAEDFAKGFFRLREPACLLVGYRRLQCFWDGHVSTLSGRNSSRLSPYNSRSALTRGSIAKGLTMQRERKILG